ncbi:MAG: AI-2E family transporter [Chloroflexi bacterium]|nr:AI-2E family transporter [Chloroflexota bacterium]
MNRQSFLPSTLTFLLTIAVLLYLVEKLGSALLAFSNVLVMLGLAWLLALILRPLVNWIHHLTLTDELLRPIRRRWGDRLADRVAHPSRGLSITIVYLLVIAVIAIIVLALVPLLIDQTRQLSITIQEQASNLPANIQRISEFINSARAFLIERLYLDPAAIVLPRPEELINQVTGFGTGLVQGALGLLGGIAATLGQFLLIVFLSVLVMIDGAKLQTQLQLMIPRRYEADMQMTFATINQAFTGFIGGTLLQSMIYGLVVMVLMTLFGMSSAVAVGAGCSLLMIVPMLGGPLSLSLPLLVGLLQGSPHTGGLLLLLAAFQVVLFNFIGPRLLSHSLQMPSLLVIVALLIGTQLIGVWGFFFAVPIAAVLYSASNVLLQRAKRNQDRLDAQSNGKPARD